MFSRLVLPLVVVGAAALMLALEVKAVFAPVAMLAVPGYWIALLVGACATWLWGFVAAAIAAGLINAALMALFGGGADASVLFLALVAPALPLAILQLFVLPFSQKKTQKKTMGAA